MKAKPAPQKSREERPKDALKKNMARRKAQARARAAQGDDADRAGPAKDEEE